MKVIGWEIRRYLPPMTLLLCGALVLLIYLAYGKDCNSRYRDGYGQSYRLSVEYQKRYGDSIDAAEWEDIKARQTEERAALDEMFESAMGQYGIHSKNDFDLLREAEEQDSEAYAEALRVWGEDGLAERLPHLKECMTLAWSEPLVSAIFHEQGVRSSIRQWEAAEEARQSFSVSQSDWYAGESDFVKARLKASLDKRETAVCSVVYSLTFPSDYLPSNVLICLLCAVVILPLPVCNTVTGVNQLQFCSRTGRKIRQKQFVAALFLTAAVNVLTDALFGAVYFFGAGNTRHLLGNRLNAGEWDHPLWLDLTYGQFVWLCFAVTLLFSLALSCVFFAVACGSRHYLTAIAAAIPLLMTEGFVFRREVQFLPLRTGSAAGFFLLPAVGLTVAAISVLLWRHSVKGGTIPAAYAAQEVRDK